MAERKGTNPMVEPVDALIDRVEGIEKDIADLRTALDGLTSVVTHVASTLATAEVLITKLNTEQANLRSALTIHQRRVHGIGESNA